MSSSVLFLPAEVKKFQDIYKKRFGETLDKKLAHKKLVALVKYVELTQLPADKNEYGYENVNARNCTKK